MYRSFFKRFFDYFCPRNNSNDIIFRLNYGYTTYQRCRPAESQACSRYIQICQLSARPWQNR